MAKEGTQYDVQGIIATYGALLKKGEAIRAMTPPGPSVDIISNWILHSVDDYIRPIMPRDIPEYQSLVDVRDTYAKVNRILPGGAISDIDMVLRHLGIARDCTYALASHSISDIPPQSVADIAFRHTKALNDFAQAKLWEQLKGKEDGRTVKTAILHTYCRMVCWMSSMSRMDKMFDFLALSAAVRAQLELYLDIHLLDRNLVDKAADKYFSFLDVKKYKDARSMVRLRHDLGLRPGEKETGADRFLASPSGQQVHVDEVRRALWGTSKKGKPIDPRHWTGRTVESRVILIAEKPIAEIYLDVYHYCNRFVHAGYSDWPGRHADDVHLLNWQSFRLANGMFSEAMVVVNSHAPVMDDAELRSEVKEIHNDAVRAMCGERVKASRAERDPH